MEFEALTRMRRGTFYSLTIQERTGYFLLPIRDIQADSKLFVKTYAPTAHLTTNFYFGAVGVDEYVDADAAVGLLLYSRLPTLNYATAVMSYSMAWQKSVSSVNILPEQTNLVYKSEEFFVYEVPTIATLVTCPELSSELNDYLTMI